MNIRKLNFLLLELSKDKYKNKETYWLCSEVQIVDVNKDVEMHSAL